MDMPEPTITSDLEGHVIETYRQPASTATGIIGNVPPVRMLVRISHRRYVDGSQWVGTDAEGLRRIVNAENITADLGPAAAGWMNW